MATALLLFVGLMVVFDMSGLLRSNKVQIGQDSDLSKNFTIQTPNPADGSLEILRGLSGEPGSSIALSISPDNRLNIQAPIDASNPATKEYVDSGRGLRILQWQNYIDADPWTTASTTNYSAFLSTAFSFYPKKIDGSTSYVALFRIARLSNPVGASYSLMHYYSGTAYSAVTANEAFIAVGPGALSGNVQLMILSPAHCRSDAGTPTITLRQRGMVGGGTGSSVTVQYQSGIIFEIEK